MANSRGPSGRGPTGRFERGPEDARREAEACRLRTRGLTYAQIAHELGYADHTGARAAVERALDAIRVEAAEELQQVELARLDHLWRVTLDVLERRHVTVNQGRVVNYDGTPVLDDGPTLQAAALLLRIQERRARLLGLDAPAKQRVEVITEDTVDDAIRELEAEVAALEAPSSGPGPSHPG